MGKRVREYAEAVKQLRQTLRPDQEALLDNLLRLGRELRGEVDE